MKWIIMKLEYNVHYCTCSVQVCQNIEIQDKSRKINQIFKLNPVPPYFLPAVIGRAYHKT